MTAQLIHRGPDDDGVWWDPEARIGFGHRRLSIVDLSAAGRQPMKSHDGRWVISFNGEIYNHADLRTQLDASGRGPAVAGHGWRGHSDTETLIECISAWGLARTVENAVGMFAISLWDAEERRLHLVRDRFGEKPLYYGWVGGDFVFASELKAIRALPAFDNRICRRALSLYTRLGYIPAPHSIFQGIFKLEPASILSGTADELRSPPTGLSPSGTVAPRRYWSYGDVVREGIQQSIQDANEAVERLESTLLEAVRGQAMADVPVGAFLSGGIDSSSVVALYRQVSRVRTFTIGYENEAFDEAPYARAVAAHLDTEHHEFLVTAREARDVIPSLSRIYDEPFGDSSQIPTFLVSRHASEQVKVALSGDGGDELFGGYNRYLASARLWSRLERLPGPVRAAIGTTMGRIPPSAWNRGAELFAGGKRQPHFGTKVQKTLRTMGGARNLDDLYRSFIDVWHGEPAPTLIDGNDSEVEIPRLDVTAPDAVRMMYQDAMTYLPDDILCKVDRAAMAVSLETRVPMLDHRVAELAARIPVGMKISGGLGKQVLRRLLSRHVPERLFVRPKTGFAIPVGEWLKGPLRPWAEALLDERRLREDGYFRPASVQRCWQDHLGGRRDAASALWYVLMFQSWLETCPSEGASTLEAARVRAGPSRT